MRGLYDAIIGRAAGRSVDQIDGDVLDVLRLGAHQWLELLTPAHAAVSESVNLAKAAKLSRSAGFVNAVMRRITERERLEWIDTVAPDSLPTLERLAITYSHPAWIVDDLARALASRGRGGELEELLRADNTPATVSLVDLEAASGHSRSLGPGPLSAGDNLVADILVADNLAVDDRTPFSLNLSGGDPGAIVKTSGGLIRVQDVGSQLAALALWSARAATPGEQWLDMCAGPGGKAALLAALAERSDAHLEANEMSEHRAKLVRQAVAPFSNVSVTVNDGRSYLASTSRFDRVLVDAPCSGLGALRRRPEARWRRTPEDVRELVRLQKQLLQAACHVVAPGGLLAYVTCTPSVAETTEVLNSVMTDRGDFAPVSVAPVIHAVTDGVVSVDDNGSHVQLWPHLNGTDAMFISIFLRSAK